MAQTKTELLTPKVLSNIAKQVRELLLIPSSSTFVSLFERMQERGLSPTSAFNLLTSALNLVESFELWMLSPKDVRSFKKGQNSLLSLAKETGGGHHQIKLGGFSPAFARSSPPSPDNSDDDWFIDNIFVSHIAEDIDNAIEWADKHDPEDKLDTRLLTAPAYQVEALWFVDKLSGGRVADDILVVTAPSDLLQTVPFQLVNSDKVPFQLVDSDDFLEALRQRKVGMGLGA